MEPLASTLFPYVVGLLIGFVIGFERERSHKAEVLPYGQRTFAFIGLLGAFAAQATSEWVAALISFFVVLAILAGYLKDTQKSGDIGMTTEFSAVVVFILGYVAVTSAATAVILGSLTLGLLAEKKYLRSLTREWVTEKEVEAFVALIVLGLGVLPFLPTEALDPWGVFVPRKLGVLVFVLALVQFLSYLLLRLFGRRAGILLGGFLAGMASSTAAFLNIRTRLESETASSRSELVLFGVMAIFASVLQSFVIIASTAEELFRGLLWSFTALFCVCLTVAILIFFASSARSTYSKPALADPLNLRKQGGFALVLFLIIAMTNVAKNLLGPAALVGVSFVSGLFELQGVTFALSTVPFSDEVLWSVAVAFLASLLSKAFIVGSVAGAPRGTRWLLLGGLGLLGAVFVLPLLVRGF